MITTNLPSTVCFVIPPDSFQTVVALLLSNNISFRLTLSSSRETASNIIELKETKNNVSSYSPSTQLSLTKKIVEAIYLKYIMGDIEYETPKDSQIAADFGISLMSFKNGFKDVYGKTFFQLYMEKKMEYAKTLIMEGLSATKVSKRIGYSSSIKFNKIFKKYFGMTPRQYHTKYKD